MSPTPQGQVQFADVLHIVSASMTLSHGVSPSTATLTIAPQLGLSEVGTLTFWYDGTAIEFHDCKIDRAQFARTASGEVWQLTLFDRRWKWRFGQISGSYNVFRDNSSLQQGEHGSIDTERTPQELAALCFEAMGESDFDVAALPNDPRPSVEWNSTPPAQALAALCDELGCRVVLRLDGTAAVVRKGDGAALPDAPALENSITVDPPEMPDQLALVCGPSRYQVDFDLEPVGLVEGSTADTEILVPIGDLPYAPSGGWSSVDLPYFNQVAASSRALAARSVFRYYRIQTPLAVPGYDGEDGNTVSRLEQILPIEAEQVAMNVESGLPASRTAVVFGVWHAENDDVANTVDALAPLYDPPASIGDTSARMLYQGGYTIDTARGLVIFDSPVYRNAHVSATGGSGYQVTVAPAQLVLRATCSVRHPETLELARHVRLRDTGASNGTEPRYLPHDELVLTHTPQYAADYSLSGVQSNATEVNARADAILDVVMAEYDSVVPQTVEYIGLLPIEVDGAIQQVTYRVGDGGATTTACRNLERSHWAGSYAQRRALERQREMEKSHQRNSPRGLARMLKTNVHARSRPRT